MEPEITSPSENGNKKKFLIILAILIVSIGVWWLLANRSNDVSGVTEAVPLIVNEPRELPHVLSSEEKALIEERIKASSTLSIIKKTPAVEQRLQNTKGVAPLTSEEKSAIEMRITI